MLLEDSRLEAKVGTFESRISKHYRQAKAGKGTSINSSAIVLTVR